MTNYYSTTLIPFVGEVKRKTAKSILFYDGAIEVWLPLSQIKMGEKGKNNCTEISVPEWLAFKKELI